MSYTKLFSSIVTSTIWTEDPKICKIWVTMLAIADRHGEVHASIPGLAQIAGMELADTETAINKFLSPDKYSRTPDDEGRRIEKIEGGWLLLNHAKYRAMASKDEEKSASAKRQAAFRERQKRNAKVTHSNAPVTPDNGAVTESRDIAEAKADTKAKAETEKREPRSREGSFPSLPEVKTYAPTVMATPECAENFWNGMEGSGWVNKFGQSIVDWKPLFRNFATAWKNNDAQRKQKDLLNPSAKKPKYPSCL